jgi:hypothetical protein
MLEAINRIYFEGQPILLQQLLPVVNASNKSRRKLIKSPERASEIFWQWSRYRI